jgi:putative transposase
MATSLGFVCIHIIFSTKDRLNLIKHEYLHEIHLYVLGIINNIHGQSISINGTENHIHILCMMPKDICLSEFVRTIKSNSSKWYHDKFSRNFAWQTGYAAFSVSKSMLPSVKNYIQNQEEHHKKVSYEDEFNKYMKIHGFDSDTLP